MTRKNLLIGLLFIVGFFVLCCLGQAQTTPVTGTIVDSDGIVWANGSISAQFLMNPSQPSPGIYNIAGTPLNQSLWQQTASLNSAGTFSFAGLYDNLSVAPLGTFWSFTVC